MMKLILLFCILFIIPYTHAQTIIQEDFNSQTPGNFSIYAGSPTYPTTIYGNSIYTDPSLNVVIRNTSNTAFENVSYVYYVNVSNNYDFITSFYDSDYLKYYEIIFINKTGVLNQYFIDCDDGVNGYHSSESNLNLNDYKDINGWIKIENNINITHNTLKLNDIEINNINLGVCNYNKTITEIIFNKNYPFYLDNILLSTIQDSEDVNLTSVINWSTSSNGLDLWIAIEKLLRMLIIIFVIGFIIVTIKGIFSNQFHAIIVDLINILIGIIVLVAIYAIITIAGSMLSVLLSQ